MPALGADMEEGTLVEWMVKPGDLVHRGQLVAAVDTDKSVIDVETFEEGVVAELLAHEGDRLPVGAPLARIVPTPASAGATPAPPTHAAPPSPAAPPPAAPHAAPPRATPPVRELAHRAGVDLRTVHGTGTAGAVTRADIQRAAQAAPARAATSAAGRRRSSPRARRLAAEAGIDLAGVTGTGPGGAVTEADLARPEAPAERRTTEPPPAPTRAPAPAHRPPEGAAAKRTAGLRRTIGALMARSKKTIPHYYLTCTIDLRAAMTWLEQANASRPVAARLVPAVLLLRATSLAAREMPEMNGFFTDGRFVAGAGVHLGVVVSLRTGGVIAPAILDADALPLDELMERFRDVVGRARSGRLQRAEMTEATITVTNLGELGVDSVLGVIYPPQVALVGFGRVSEQPWAHDGMVGVRPAVTATLSADHRVSDGMRGARFLSRIDELLQKPEAL